MGSFSIWHWVVVLIIVLVLFGRGRVADIMGEFGKGITSFKKGVNEETARTADPVAPAARIEPPASAPATSAPAAPAPVAADPVPAAPVATEHTPPADDRPGV